MRPFLHALNQCKILCISAKSTKIFSNLQTRPLQTVNWFLAKDLSQKVQPKEYWTGLFLQISNNALPSEINLVNSASTFSIYNPLWNALEPQIDVSSKEVTRCISINFNADSSNEYGWKLKDCTEELPTICETFGCLHGIENSCNFIFCNFRPISMFGQQCLYSTNI